MKIAIITLYGLTNYGNRLQNYALHRALEDMGHEAESLVAESPRDRLLHTALLYLDKRNGHIVLRDSLERRRERSFRAFLRQYTPTRILLVKDRRFKSTLEKDYDCFLVGSDQVWNPLFWNKRDFGASANNYLLQFVHEKKKLSYAASFGIAELDGRYTELFRRALADFDARSVREEAAQRLLADELGLSAELVLDPTLLIGAEEWRALEKGSVDGGEKFIAVYFLGEQPEEVWDYIRRTAAEAGARVVTILDEKDRETYTLGPEAFLELIDKAALCFTDSFHACVFSLLFHTPFVVYKRRHRNRSDMSSRIDTLLKTVGMEDRFCDGPVCEKLWDCSFEESDALLARARERSLAILRGMLEAPRLERSAEAAVSPAAERPAEAGEVPARIEIRDKSACCGCGACAQSCPQGCITMERDDEGFLYPHIGAGLCVGCGRCRQVCPMLHPERREAAPVSEAWGVIHRDGDVHRLSSSGGAFTALASQVLKEGGCVFGAAFSPDFGKVVHIRVDREEELVRLRGSKYLQSEIGGCYADAKAELLAGRRVLFSGTPCQIAGLRGFLGRDYEGLLCVDVFCHGTPSPLLWEHCLQHAEDGLGGRAVAVSFRHKEAAPPSPVPAGQRRYYGVKGRDPYLKMFLNDFCLRESCYRCAVKESGFVSDLSLGDFWGVETVAPELDDPLGVSLVLLHTEKGRRFFNAVLPALEGAPVDFDAAIAKNAAVDHSVARPPERDVFFDDLRSGGWPLAEAKYARDALKTRLRKRLSSSFLGDLKRRLRSGGAAPAKRPSLQYGLLISVKKK